LRSLLLQDYPGSLHLVLVDDQSTDGTGEIPQQVAQELHKANQIEVISTPALPPTWTGKLWAMEQGIRQAEKLTPPPDYFLFTDADIQHDRGNLRQLVTKAQAEDLDLVSLMVLLRCESFWEQLLIPAFVFFFQKVYPFSWVNNPHHPIAAAAGGCILIRRQALNQIGGIQVIRDTLIDDCTLAKAVKSLRGFQGGTEVTGKIWLGLTSATRSLRPYPNLNSIWNMVARTAFTQLNYSRFLLLGTVLGMTIVYLVPPLGGIIGGLMGNWILAIAGLSGWFLMAIAYYPTLRLYQRSPLFAITLPGVGLLYTLITLDSARLHWQGRGGAWKGRVYQETKK
jgi:hopene-associated glycosyltransferase HpnB